MNISLKTLANATQQDVFNHVAKHLLQQNEKCLIGGNLNRCAYKDDTGKSCAAGCLIDKDEYQEDFEDRQWYQLAGVGLVPSAHLNLISALQQVHDETSPAEWRYELAEVAEQFGLNKYELVYK